MTPLDAFVARWNAAGISVPFHDVINTQVDLDDMPDLWASAISQTQDRPDVTMGSTPFVQEDGYILCAMFARAGMGRAALDAAVAEVRTHFAGYATGIPEILFTQVNGPEDLDPQTEGNWWQVGLTIPFQVYTQRAEPPLPVGVP